MVYTKVKKFFQSYIVGLGNRQAFSQTMTAGCPKGMFSHKIIRDYVNFLVFLPKWAFIGWLKTLMAKTRKTEYLTPYKTSNLMLLLEL